MKNLFKRIPGVGRLSEAIAPAAQDRRMFLLEKMPQGSVCAEIGVHKGDFSELILKVVQPKQLHLIDPWHYEASESYKEAWYGGQAQGGQTEMDARYQSVCARFAVQSQAGQLTIHRGYSSEMLKQFSADSLDWIYIDGNHLYEFVKSDLELSLEKTKPGGYITGDDYTDGGWWQGGVKKAVKEFVKTHKVKLIQVRHSQFILQKSR
jgi:hypothetical protein